MTREVHTTRRVPRALMMRVEHLTPLLVVDPLPRPADLWEDLDRNGMRNPLLVVPLSLEAWTARLEKSPRSREVRPVIHKGRVWVVRVGNQRLKWATARGYSWAPVVVCESFERALEWQERCYV